MGVLDDLEAAQQAWTEEVGGDDEDDFELDVMNALFKHRDVLLAVCRAAVAYRDERAKPLPKTKPDIDARIQALEVLWQALLAATEGLT